MPRFLENRLIAEFQTRGAFSKDELLSFYQTLEPQLNESTFAWRVHDLCQRGVLRVIKNGVYTLDALPAYHPQVDTELAKISKYLEANFKGVKYCLWDTAWLNEFSLHQSPVKMRIVEIEKDCMESLFHGLKDNFTFDAFLNPDKKTIDLYLSESRSAVVVRKFISRSPLIHAQNGKKNYHLLPALEKVLADLYIDIDLLYFYQGQELSYIYDVAAKKYGLNYSKLFSYASRRKKSEELKAFINHHASVMARDMRQ